MYHEDISDRAIKDCKGHGKVQSINEITPDILDTYQKTLVGYAIKVKKKCR